MGFVNMFKALQPENLVYSECLHTSQEGHAYWPKALSHDLQPGAIGYIDGYGDWRTIARLADLTTVSDIAIKAPARSINIKQDRGDSWTPITSDDVTGAIIGFEGKAIPPGTTIGADAGVKYTCHTFRGAILMARGLVTKSYLSVTDEKMARAWVDDNLNDLVDRGDIVSIKQRGLWLITKTHHTSECAKKVLQGKDTSVAFHVGANIPDIAKAQASSQWWSSEAANSGWRVHRSGSVEQSVSTTTLESVPSHGLNGATGCAATPSTIVPISDSSVGVVMFFGGVWWEPRGLWSRNFKETTERERQKFLGPDDADSAPDSFIKNPNTSDEEEAYVGFTAVVI